MQAKLLKAEKLGGQLKVNMLLSAAPAILNRVVRLLHKDLSVEIKETRERRSLEQNAKAWALMGEMAHILGANKDDIYLEMLRRYGQSVIVTTKKDIPLDRVFKYYEKLKDGLSNGREFTAWRVFIGSSQYSDIEMQHFISNIECEAKELGIDVDKYADELQTHGAGTLSHSCPSHQ